MSGGNPDKVNSLNVYLAEYNTLRSELLARIQTQNQTFNFLLIIVGAAITAVLSTANSGKADHLGSVVIAVALLLPLIACPLAYMFFDNELMIHAIGSYLYWDRRPRLVELTGDPFLLKSISDFSYLPSSTRSVFQPISRGRWYLFCIPTFLPILFLPLYVYVRRDSLPDYSVAVEASALAIFVLDLLEVAVLARAIRWVFDNNRHQHRRTAEAREES